MDQPILTGNHVRLEPLELRHLDGLLAAANADPSLYNMTFVPQTGEAMSAYINTALDWRAKGIALPFATIRLQDGVILGSTRFYDIENFPWPAGHPQHGRTTPDVCEIGYTWLTRSAIRTGANTEAKLLMLTHAFESWDVHRVCLHTDARNTRSREAISAWAPSLKGSCARIKWRLTSQVAIRRVSPSPQPNGLKSSRDSAHSSTHATPKPQQSRLRHADHNRVRALAELVARILTRPHIRLHVGRNRGPYLRETDDRGSRCHGWHAAHQ